MKALQIAFKDLTVLFRDRTALLLMLGAPLILTVGLALISGRMSGSSGPAFQNLPVVIVNLDQGVVGGQLADAFSSDELDDLLNPQTAEDAAAARALVNDDKVVAAVIIPAGFTDAVTGAKESGAADRIEIYANPNREISSQIVTAVVESFVQQVELARVSGQVAVEQLLAAGLINPQEAAAVGMRVAERSVSAQNSGAAIRLVSAEKSTEPEQDFDMMGYFAPSMAILFLMYTVALGGRNLLAEKETGTLGRLVSAPISETAILGGKLLGIFLVATAQMSILILANALLFGVKFGDPLGVAVLILALAAAASGWGILVAAIARTPGQVSTIGMALMLTFGVLGGSFIPINNMPAWFNLVSKITPNAWGIEGFIALGYGDTLPQLAGTVAGLFGMAAVLFIVSVTLLRRKNLMQG
ncbi:MAG: ABC transporter permease [Anaerolineales bacterium]|nr:ABC transporter permease [Anaerolineales bacterium]